MKDINLVNCEPRFTEHSDERAAIIFDRIIPRLAERFYSLSGFTEKDKCALATVDFTSQQIGPIIPFIELCFDAPSYKFIVLLQDGSLEKYLGYSKSQMAGVHRAEQNAARLMAIRLEDSGYSQNYYIHYSTGEDLDLPVFLLLKRKD